MAHRVLVTLMSQVCQNFYQDTELVFAKCGGIWYNINMEKDIFTIREIHFHMVEDMCILCNIILSGARNIENRF